MKAQKKVISCIDNSNYAKSVCLYSLWLAKQLDLPVTFLHALEKEPVSQSSDFSGNLGFDTQDQLMSELIEVESKRAKILKEQGKQLLDSAKKIALYQQFNQVETLQLHGLLPDVLSCIEQAAIIVLGHQGERSQVNGHIGSQLESVIRLQKTPVLICVNEFTVPKKVMIAYDGSATSHKIIDEISKSDLLNHSECHLVMNGQNDEMLLAAQSILDKSGIKTKSQLIQGENVAASLLDFAEKNEIDLIIMGAYGHSKLREFFIGSNTTTMIAKTKVSLLMYRG